MEASQSYFSPLALAQVLPFLPLAQSRVDYHTELRQVHNLLKHVLEDKQAGARVCLVRSGQVAVPLKSLERSKLAGGPVRLAMLSGEYLPQQLRGSQESCDALYYLGASGKEHFFALDLQAADALLSGDQGSERARQFVQAAANRFDWLDLAVLAARCSARDAGLATSAVALSAWQGSQDYCPSCGAPVRADGNGWTQYCSEEGRARTLFPRIEPAVITAIVDSQDRLLLVHNASWPTDRYAMCAGFVEAGESLEHAVSRETMEELGIPLGQMRYIGSQPWPFPASLMMAFKAQALSTQIRVDGQEVSDARWMTRDEYSQAIDLGQMSAPRKASVAHSMIEQWLGREL
ncbi:phosphohydrolase [Bombiscardovia nodaiensis]|uniref:NAD(+) diphosphatase n=1 Tax=Bombiscardovia nodaiensis TaxID=2932181 RepID=A0ABM8B957_9BIFI|nr:phosphohydrolase [Bombiscardovia nodaiensis]